MSPASEAIVGQHERRVAQRWGRESARRLQTRGKPYNNIGYWKDRPVDLDDASQRLLREAALRADLGPESRVLDVGCGFGQSSIDIRRDYGCRRVVGVDLTPEHIQFATRLAEKEGLGESVQFAQMSATRLVFPDESFDCVIAVDCACQFLTRAEFFKEASRVLTAGGCLVLADAVVPPPPSRGLRGLLARFLVKAWSIPEQNIGSVDTYVGALERAGFSAIDAADIGVHVYGPVSEYLNGSPYREKYRAVNGLGRVMLMGFLFRQMAHASARGELHYYLFKAVKPRQSRSAS